MHVLTIAKILKDTISSHFSKWWTFKIFGAEFNKTQWLNENVYRRTIICWQSSVSSIITNLLQLVGAQLFYDYLY